MKTKQNSGNRQIVKKLFFNIIFIIILSNLINALTNFTDGICASRLINDGASSALAIIAPLITFLTVISSVIQIGSQIVASKKLAQGDITGAKKIFSTSVALCALLGTIFGLIIILLCTYTNILFDFGADKNVTFSYAYWYVIGYFCGAPFFVAFTALLPLGNLVSGKKITTASILTVLFVNVVGDILSGVLYKYGAHAADTSFGQWAMLGIAIATSLSYVAGIVVLSFAFSSKKATLKFSFKSISLTSARNILLIGLPGGVKLIFMFFRKVVFNIILANAHIWVADIPRYNPLVLFTAFSAVAHITLFVGSICEGLSAACLSLSSIFYAEEDEDSLNELFLLVFKIVLIVIIPISGIYALLTPTLVKAYGIGATADPVLSALMIEQAELALYFDATAIPFAAISAAFLAFFQGTCQIKHMYVTAILQSFVLPVMSFMLFTFAFSFNGNVWAGAALGYVFYIFYHIIYTFIHAKIHHHKFRFDVRTFFYFPASFGLKDNQTLKASIRGINDVMTLTSQVIAFCERQGLDKRRANNIVSCVEELARSIVISGFTLDYKKHHVCEFCLMIKKTDSENNVILRFRDDCPLYSLQERAKRVEVKNDPAANVALKIIYRNAKEVKYSSLLKTNNLIIIV